MTGAIGTFIPGNVSGVLDSIVKGRIVPAVDRSTGIVTGAAKQIVPVDTGELRDSIHPEPAVDHNSQVVGAVVADAGHALFVERGTVKMAAQPYLRPSLISTEQEVLREFGS